MDDDLNIEKISSLEFSDFTNSQKIDAFDSHKNAVFKLTVNTESSDKKTVLIADHYFNAVGLVHGGSTGINWIRQNQYIPNRRYSTNVIAFDIPGSVQSKVYYILVKNVVPSKIAFYLEATKHVAQYDRRISTVFTAVYAAIITLALVNLVFFFFIRQRSYLFYALYISSFLIGLLYLEGTIAYFEQLSKPFLGIYTTACITTLPNIFFLSFVIHFLGVKKLSILDYRICLSLILMSVAVLCFCILFYAVSADKFYPVVVLFFNSLMACAALVVMYVSIKHSILGNRQAKFLAFSWLIFMTSVCMRIYSTFNPEPLDFWVVRFMEFAFFGETLILSFGLADRTSQFMKQRDHALYRINQADRALYAREVIHSFQSKASHVIDKHFGAEQKLDTIINSYLIASIEQIIGTEFDDVFFVFKSNHQLKLKSISCQSNLLNLKRFVAESEETISHVMQGNTIQSMNYRQADAYNIELMIVPVQGISNNGLCLVLSSADKTNKLGETDVQELGSNINKLSQSYADILKLQKINHESKIDALTQTYNRKSIELRVDQILKVNKGAVAIAFIDVDDFKNINDQNGHAVGDDCLIFLCQNLKYIFNKQAFVGRLGGDEFVVVFEDGNDTEIEQQILALYELLAKHKIHDIQLSISIGVAVANIRGRVISQASLLKTADEQLYKAKEQGKNTYLISKF